MTWIADKAEKQHKFGIWKTAVLWSFANKTHKNESDEKSADVIWKVTWLYCIVLYCKYEFLDNLEFYECFQNATIDDLSPNSCLWKWQTSVMNKCNNI